MGRDRLIGQPMLDVFGQRARRCITIRRLERHRLEADRFERLGNARIDRSRPRKLAALDFAQDFRGVDAIKGCATRQDNVERGAQAVDITRGAQQVEPTLGLLGAHVGRCTEGGARNRLARAAGRRRAQGRFGARVAGGGLVAADDFRQAPIDDQGLAIGAEQDIAGLDVAMENAAAVGVGDRVADIEEARQQAAEGERGRDKPSVPLDPTGRGVRGESARRAEVSSRPLTCPSPGAGPLPVRATGGCCSSARGSRQ